MGVRVLVIKRVVVSCAVLLRVVDAKDIQEDEKGGGEGMFM